tara:strand:+ start:28 stop:1860 length:1833 start_codon:yes stop_codon:yes gene_type:complete
MIFSGTNFRRIQEKEDYNFFLDASISNTTGNAAFGFSGETEKFTFDFVEGRIIDPNDKYTFSYNSGNFQLSGVVNDQNYNYFINNERIVFSGTKNSFKADRFFIDSTGCSLDVNNLIIDGSGSTTFNFQNMNQLVGDSGHFTGEIVVNDPAFGKFDIFSGEVLTPDVTGLFSILTNFSTGIEATGILGVSGIQGIENQSPYNFEAILYTSFGQVVKTFNVTGTTPFYDASLTLTDLQDSVESGGFPNLTKNLNYIASNTLFTGAPSYATGLPINIELSYSGGFTGQITGALTGVQVLTSGVNYSSNFLPEIEISGDGQNAFVTGLVASNGSLRGIDIFLGGSGYSEAPSILIYSGVNSVSINNSGHGYFSSPVVEFSGGRDGGAIASATFNVSNGSISSISMNSAGTRYVGVPTLNVIPGLSGVIITNSGSGYLSDPTIFINNGGGSGAAINALTGSGFITGFDLISGGSGYTGTPTILISGGSPSITGSGDAVLSSGFSGTVIMSSGATATGFIGDYTKEFTGVFNLLTGSGSSYLNFRETGQITSDNLSYTGESIFFRENDTLSIGVESEINVQVQNYNYYDSFPMIALLTASGSGSQISTLEVTGIK